jgi:1,4-dihydroxy-2-naphthoate octaprenyltransferase
VAYSIWVKELRAPFLLLPTIFVPLGVAIAWDHGSFNLFTAVLTLLGVLCLHASVNVLNDYFDFKNGIDLATTPTPFSGGSRVLPANELAPASVLYGGLLFLLGGVAIGGYFIYSFAFDPVLVAILAIAAVSVVGYSSVLSRAGIGELMAGLNFGPLLLLGTYYVQTRRIDAAPLIVGLALGLMVAGILYINEFPDAVADQRAGRRHLIIRWGKAKAALRFRVVVVGAYFIIVTGILVGLVTPLALVSLLAFPKAWKAAKTLGEKYDKPMELIPGMASMVMATLWTGGLLLGAYLILHFI